MRQKKKKTKDKNPQKKEDASPSSPPEEEGMGLNLVMASKIKRWSQGLFFCFLVFMPINTKAFALDKKASFVLSHYIMGAVYERLQDIDRAVSEYKKALKADSKNTVIHLDLASIYIKKNDIPQAIEELTLTARLDPEAVEPHAILAILYSSQNKPDLAATEYEIALKNASKLQPENIDIYKSLAAIYLAQKKYKDAENTYRLILNLSPNDAQAHFYLANIYEELKKRDAGVLELKKSLQLNPDYHEALNYLGYLYVEENRNLDEAEVMIRKALEIQPDNGAYVDSLGWLYFKQGKFKEAIKELEKASSLLEDPVINDHLGDVYLKTGDIEKAKLNWQKSLELDPKHDEVQKKIEELNKR